MNNSTKYMIGALIVLVGVVGVSFYSCEKEEISPNEYTPQAEIQELDANASNTERITPDINDPAEEHITPSDFLNENYEFVEPEQLCGKAYKKNMINESGRTVGASYVFNTDKYFYVWLVTNQGIEMNTAYLQLASSPKMIPRTEEGTPDYAKFDYTTGEDKEFSRVLSFKIPISEVDGESWVVVMAKSKNEHGNWIKTWVGESIFNGKLPVRIFDYKEQKCIVDPKDPGAPSTDEAES